MVRRERECDNYKFVDKTSLRDLEFTGSSNIFALSIASFEQLKSPAATTILSKK